MTVAQEKSLRHISRARSYLLVCFYTLPLYVAGLILLLNNGRSITTLMYVYMLVYAIFAINMAMRHCPRCQQQFFVRHVFLNVVTHKCTHCGQSMHPDHHEKF